MMSCMKFYNKPTSTEAALGVPLMALYIFHVAIEQPCKMDWLEGARSVEQCNLVQ